MRTAAHCDRSNDKMHRPTKKREKVIIVISQPKENRRCILTL